MKRTVRTVGGYVCVVAVWLCVWCFASYAVSNEIILPGISTVFVRLAQLASTVSFWASVGLSLLRVIGGVIVAVVLALGAAALSAKVRVFHMFILPLNAVVKATPIVSFIFIAYIAFMRGIGIGYLPAFITLLIVFPIVFENILTAIRGVDRELIEVSEVFGCTRAEKLRYLWIPTVAPNFVSSFRTATGLGWKAGIAAEALVAGTSLTGIGTGIADAKTFLETPDIFAWTVTIIFISMLIEFIFTSVCGFIVKKYY